MTDSNRPASADSSNPPPDSIPTATAVERSPGPAAGNAGSAPRNSPTVVVHAAPRRSWLTWVGWTGFGVCLFLLIGVQSSLSDYFDTSEGITEKFHSGAKLAADKVAVITISGVIMDGEGFVKQQIDRVRKDDNVKAIVVRVNSPGGTVTGSDYMFHHLTKLREEKNVPLVVSMGSIATSGGYYVSMAVGDQEKAIFAEPTTTTGSIGVIIPHYDVSGLMERFDIKDDSIATHPRKQMLSMTRPLPEEHRELLEAYIGESFGRFKEVIQQGRPVFRETPEKLDELATGEIFTANQALRHGLVDEIGFLEKAVDRAVELAKLDADRVRVIRYEPPVTLLGLGGMAQSLASERSTESELQRLLQWSTPRAYYVWTSLPPLLDSRLLHTVR